MGEKMKLAAIRRLKKELAELEKDRDSWERRTRYLEAKANEVRPWWTWKPIRRTSAPVTDDYEYHGEGIAQ